MMTKADREESKNVKRGEVVFLEGHEVQTLNILLQGKVDVFISSTNKKTESVLDKSYRIFSIDKNLFFGANDIIQGSKHSFSFLAAEDSSLYLYPVNTPGQVWSFISSRKDYGTYMVNSINSMITSSIKTLNTLKATEASMKIVTENLATWFWVLKEACQLLATPSSPFFRNGLDRLHSMREKGLKPSPVFSSHFIEENHEDTTGEEATIPASQLKAEYFQHLCNLPAELQKNFFASDMFITSYHCREEAQCLEYIISSLRDTFSSVETYFSILYSDNTDSIYSVYKSAAVELAEAGSDYRPALEALEYIFKTTNDMITLYKQQYLHKCETDIEYLRLSFNNVKALVKNAEGKIKKGPDGKLVASTDFSSLPEELINSAEKIIEYAELPRNQAETLMINLMAFRNLKDRLSIDDNARHIRNNVASAFFDVYEAVFRKAILLKDNSRLISMFINYGYMDEKLLTPEQTMELYKIAGKTVTENNIPCYYMWEWLSNIYSMQKDPSINEFGQDYFDVYREMKKRGQVSEKEKMAYENDMDARLSFEIKNMLRTNHKLCHGQTSVYFPILHKDIIIRDLHKVLVTPEKLQSSLEKILDVDFSAFYREIHYIDENKLIEKELIMKSITPEIILLPAYGPRAFMWQEITGRNRNTPGRFILPVFIDEDLDATLLRLVGNFRWELCRTMMGSAWNDVTQSSLTSEYTDYIQFYKKNKDLTEDAKEKVRAQTAKYHGRMRDIFTSDYEIWVNNEAKGNVRLNKVVRGILYRHCPFSKPIREQLEKQPMYSEVATHFRNQRAKTAKDLENKYNRYIRNNISIGPELEHNLAFYRDM